MADSLGGGGGNAVVGDDVEDEPASLTHLAGLSLVSRLEDSSYLRTIPEDRLGGGDDDDDVEAGVGGCPPLGAAGGVAGAGGGTAALTADMFRPGQQPDRPPGSSSVNSEAASSTGAMVLEEEEEEGEEVVLGGGKRKLGGGRGGPVGGGGGGGADAAAGPESSGTPSSTHAVLASAGGTSSDAAVAAVIRTGSDAGAAVAGGGAAGSSGSGGSRAGRGRGSKSSTTMVRCPSVDLKSKKTRCILVLSLALTAAVVVAIALVSTYLTAPDPKAEMAAPAAAPIDETNQSDGSGKGGGIGSGGGGGIMAGSSPSPSPEPDDWQPEPEMFDGGMEPRQPEPGAEEQLDAVLYEVSDPSTFSDPTSPQSKARNWMLYDDYLLYDVLEEGSDRTAQRYACAEMIFALVDGGGRRGRTRTRRRQRRRGRGLQEEVVEEVQEPRTVDYYLRPDQEVCEWPGFGCDAGRVGHAVTMIYLPNSGLAGSLPQEMKNLTHLKELNLSQNAITGNLPSLWFHRSTSFYEDDYRYDKNRPLKDLYMLDLSDNLLTGTVDHELFELPVLRFLYLQNNKFESVQPSIAGRLDGTFAETPPHLEYVWLQNNILTGTFPAWILADFPELRSLWMGRNRLKGQLPGLSPPNGRFPANITYFDLSFNQLTGTLPQALLSIPSLKSFYVEGNQLSGPLPDETTNRLMVNVVLHDNRFTGSLPEDFGTEWTLLSQLTLHGNNITGTISNKQCQAWESIKVLTYDCGEITCDCCSPEQVCYERP